MVGEVIKASAISRDDLYITTKLGYVLSCYMLSATSHSVRVLPSSWYCESVAHTELCGANRNSSHHHVVEAFEESLAKLDCGYIDMYLMHWPQAVVDGTTRLFLPCHRDNVEFYIDSASSPSFNPAGRVLPPDSSPTIVDTWLSMQSLLNTHKSQLRSIGVSNFSIKTLNVLLGDARVTVIPGVNQVECHPYLPNEELKEWCSEKGIAVVAYSPLGSSSLVFARTCPLIYIRIIARRSTTLHPEHGGAA